MKKVLNKIKKIPVKILMLGTLIIVLIPPLYTFTRFTTEIIKDYYLESKNFYFNSNRLKKDNPLYKINNWTGVGDFTIEIVVNSRKNNLLASNFDVAYEIDYNCPNDVLCSANKNNGVIYNATHTDSFIITITPTRAFDDGESIIMHVEATSTNPYISQISADFEIVVGKRGVSYTIDDEANRPYLLFAITNAIPSYTVKEAFGSHQVGDEIDINEYRGLSDINKAKCVSVTIDLLFDPNQIVLDTTSDILKTGTVENTNIGGILYVNRIVFPMEAMSSKEVRFYKIDHTKNYSYPFETEPLTIQFNAQ